MVMVLIYFSLLFLLFSSGLKYNPVLAQNLYTP